MGIQWNVVISAVTTKLNSINTLDLVNFEVNIQAVKEST